jgi:pyridoxal phosphate enzyme (YggS family)
VPYRDKYNALEGMNNPMNGSKSDLIERFQATIQRIRRAEKTWNRPAGSVELVGAAKMQSSRKISELASMGLRAVGENYLQEAISKQDELKALEIEWHFIGRIQSNKTRVLAERFDWVHGVDRLKIVERLSSQRPSDAQALNIFLQINIDGQATKSGRSLEDLEDIANATSSLDGVRLRGLMAIPAPQKEFDEQRRSFAAIQEAMNTLNQRCGLHMECLSMGMSGDLEAAIAEGATHVRIGTALFGPRPANR